MSMKNLNNLDLKTLLSKIMPFLQKIRRYAVVIFIAVIFIMYSFLVLRISSLSRKEPSDDELTEKLLSIKRPKINQDDVDKMLELEDNGSDAKALFKQARSNPFHE